MKDKAIVYKEANFNNVEPFSFFKNNSFRHIHSPNTHNRKRMSYGGGDMVQFNFQFYNSFLKKITDDRNKEPTPYNKLTKKLSYSTKNMIKLPRTKRNSVQGNATPISRSNYGSSHHNKEVNEKNKMVSNNTITEYAKGERRNDEERKEDVDKGGGNDVVTKYVGVEEDGRVKDKYIEGGDVVIKKCVNEGNVDTESSDKNKMKGKNNKSLFKKLICCLN